MIRRPACFATTAALAALLLPAFTLHTAFASPMPDGQTAAAPAADSQIEPQAESLLKRAADSLTGLRSLSATVVEISSFPPTAQRPNTIRQRNIREETYAHPGYFAAEGKFGSPSKADPNVFTYTPSGVDKIDGTTRWSYFPFSNKYRKEPAAEGYEVDVLQRLQSFLRPFNGFYNSKATVWSDVQRLKKEGRVRTLHLAGNEDWEGASYQVVELVFADDVEFSDEVLKPLNGQVPTYTYRFYIGKDDLIHRTTNTHPIRGQREYQVSNLKTNFPFEPSQFAFTPPAGATELPEMEQPIMAGMAPDFTTTDKDGKTVKLSDFKGKVVVLDFWATWCQPCQKALPHMRRVYDAVSGQDVVFLGVCVWDDRSAFDSWIRRKKDIYPFVFGFDAAARDSKNSIASKLYSVHAIPVTYVIDTNGVLSSTIIDFQENDSRLEKALQKVGIKVAAPVSAHETASALQ